MDVWTLEDWLRQRCWCLSHQITGGTGDPSLLCIVPYGLGGSVLRGAQRTAGAVGVSDTLAGTQMAQTRLAL